MMSNLRQNKIAWLQSLYHLSIDWSSWLYAPTCQTSTCILVF